MYRPSTGDLPSAQSAFRHLLILSDSRLPAICSAECRTRCSAMSAGNRSGQPSSSVRPFRSAPGRRAASDPGDPEGRADGQRPPRCISESRRTGPPSQRARGLQRDRGRVSDPGEAAKSCRCRRRLRRDRDEGLAAVRQAHQGRLNYPSSPGNSRKSRFRRSGGQVHGAAGRTCSTALNLGNGVGSRRRVEQDRGVTMRGSMA
jgi:hypothetical protein